MFSVLLSFRNWKGNYSTSALKNCFKVFGQVTFFEKFFNPAVILWNFRKLYNLQYFKFSKILQSTVWIYCNALSQANT